MCFHDLLCRYRTILRLAAVIAFFAVGVGIKASGPERESSELAPLLEGDGVAPAGCRPAAGQGKVLTTLNLEGVPPLQFPDDDSLVAHYWRRAKTAEALAREVERQFDLTVCYGERCKAVDHMLEAMLAELRILYADDPPFIAAMEASQAAWLDYSEAQFAMRFPDWETGGYGSSASMVSSLVREGIIIDRIRELMPWYVGTDCEDEHSIGDGSLRCNDSIARTKEQLRADGHLPLNPTDICDETTPETDWLEPIRQQVEVRRLESKASTYGSSSE